MTDVIEHIETDVRARILVTAERLFREITGRPRSRTSPEPCASARRISTVSLDSKKSINADVAHRLMWEVERRSYHHAPTATERLHELPKPYIG